MELILLFLGDFTLVHAFHAFVIFLIRYRSHARSTLIWLLLLPLSDFTLFHAFHAFVILGFVWRDPLGATTTYDST